MPLFQYGLTWDRVRNSNSAKYAMFSVIKVQHIHIKLFRTELLCCLGFLVVHHPRLRIVYTPFSLRNLASCLSTDTIELRYLFVWHHSKLFLSCDLVSRINVAKQILDGIVLPCTCHIMSNQIHQSIASNKRRIFCILQFRMLK